MMAKANSDELEQSEKDLTRQRKAREYAVQVTVLGGNYNPSTKFTMLDCEERRLGPMISGKVLLNPVSLPLNALIKKEKPVAYVRNPKM